MTELTVPPPPPPEAQIEVRQNDAAKELAAAYDNLPIALRGDNQQLLARIDRKHMQAGIAFAYESIGGHAALAVWADKNRGEFYTKLLPKLLPRHVEVDDRRSIEDVIFGVDEEDAIDVDYEPA